MEPVATSLGLISATAEVTAGGNQTTSMHGLSLAVLHSRLVYFDSVSV